MFTLKRATRFKEKVTKGFRFFLRPLARILFLGVDGSIASSQNRVTLMTNSLALIGIFTNFMMTGQIEQMGISGDLVLYYYAAYLLVPPIFFFNWKREHNMARFLVVVAIIYLTMGGSVFYGKSFNGHYNFIIAILFSIIAFSRQRAWVRAGVFLFAFSFLPMVDYLNYIEVFPLTGLNALDFAPTILYFDSVQSSLFISVIVLTEFYYSMKYKSDLESLRNNLESLVEKRTESYRIASEEAQKANLRKSQFLANTSHELRTPLQGILGFSQLADKKMDKIEKAKDFNAAVGRVRAQMTRVDGNSRRLLELVEKLLVLSRMDSKQKKRVGSEYSLIQDVEELVANFISQEQEDRILFTTNLDRNAKIITDGSLFRSILHNLIENALKYSDPSSNVKLDLEYDGRFLNCTITNQGIGIPEEETEDIFEAFFQSSRSDQHVGGTGLGLTLSSKYAKFLGGEVKLTSGSPEKTEFLFSIKIELLSEASELAAA